MACVRIGRLMIGVLGGLGRRLSWLVLMLRLRRGLLRLVLMFSLGRLLRFVLMLGLSLRRFRVCVFRAGLITRSVVVMPGTGGHRRLDLLLLFRSQRRKLSEKQNRLPDFFRLVSLSERRHALIRNAVRYRAKQLGVGLRLDPFRGEISGAQGLTHLGVGFTKTSVATRAVRVEVIETHRDVLRARTNRILI